ncbi:hypothetical protein A2858_03130 [Candidatus Daviesbacteria bacterium RIFCSPHIGHO2_01_FULL_36_37]|uniref:Serine aminopeptidase S33 domain-containing protein n=2 Tax=Candidatus Daviesiibacteriota TaxID=1752718 RepID=A0A1F5K5E6_9BACT|nr:MAG: hypothetical protein A2858_03130 [Candidatus Daviesbacteria bacterium RIFCSPHIGHO2_01_FULL_36_37]OGE36034.1 MAG: hypothetical protein A3E66_01015 [Candidatus Daviesbacteria bacterium RIFCSPHIGHO2_12_FULL_37_16]
MYFLKDSNKSNLQPIIQSSLKLNSPAPSPFPFEELTIPFLRNKEFKSSLGELKLVSSNGNYTSYLTSYTSDGLKINGLLTKPSGEMPSGGWPAIVFVHGYIPPKTYQTLEKYTMHVNFLASNGFVVFKIDLRGHGTSEGEAGGGYYSSDYIVDVLNARAALQNSDFVNKVGLWGHSMAGNVVMRAFAAKPEIPAVVIWAGAVYTYKDLADYGISDNSYQPLPSDSERQRKRQELRNLYGDAKDGNPFWNLVAPTNYLNDLKGALSLNHAVNDDVVSIEYSRNLSRLLNDTLVTHELHEYPNGGHNINGSSFTQAMQNTVEFFKKYLSN